MQYWIFPWKEKHFDLFGCLMEFGYVEWRQQNKVSVGDRVIIYSGKPISRFICLLMITEIDIPFSENVTWKYAVAKGDDTINPSQYYSKLEPIAWLDESNPVFSCEYLVSIGLPDRVRSNLKAKSQFIDIVIRNTRDFHPNFNLKDSEFEEGALKYRMHKSFERNPAARNECLRINGYRCKICGINFEEKYGPIGRDFIEVHHIDFISKSGGQTHKINPRFNLIPVCSNCHSMLHRKLNGTYLTPEQLEKSLHNNTAK